ncbi:hypothetical protein E0I26_15920 [Flavobacterium rhamnosiphilum]|uniref:Right handed beta helix domain-containing protein n=1 Tax=Flavobacterium rhamnosiphilum TaxID=2541724 RepID=A0A4R5F2X7_9FLAO|nr:right-handed parallel beta-helix repeat-containing protein [Flavobacterium rhamnosiphilum]TDE41746.1 hypothetical protein E0I26_15920 [Flavobacterium rhamnosiphilum]
MKFKISTLFFILFFCVYSNAQKIMVESFGAKGDGKTDDSKALNALFRSKYRDCFLTKNKVYRVKNKLFLNSNKVIHGNNATLICDESLDTLFYGCNKKNIVLRDLTILGTSKENKKQIAFWLKNVNSFSLENSKLSGDKFNSGFSLGVFCYSECDNMSLVNNLFNNIKGTVSGSGYAIHTKDSKKVKIFNNTFRANKGDSRHAIYLSAGTQNAHVKGNNIYNYECGAISLYSYYYQKPTQNNLLEQNYIYGGTNKFEFDGSITIFQNCNNNIIKNNTIIKSGAYGIVLSGDTVHIPMSKCLNNQIIGNKIDSCTNAGIATWGAHFTKIRENEISNTNWNRKDLTLCALGVYDDCNYKGNNEGTEVIDNILIKNPNCKYAIRVWANTKDNFKEKGNEIELNMKNQYFTSNINPLSIKGFLSTNKLPVFLFCLVLCTGVIWKMIR